MKKFVVSVIVLLVLGAGAALANVFITPSPSAQSTARYAVQKI